MLSCNLRDIFLKFWGSIKKMKNISFNVFFGTVLSCVFMSGALASNQYTTTVKHYKDKQVYCFSSTGPDRPGGLVCRGNSTEANAIKVKMEQQSAAYVANEKAAWAREDRMRAERERKIALAERKRALAFKKQQERIRKAALERQRKAAALQEQRRKALQKTKG